jgi:large subunit ribosomal protein L9
MKIILTETVDKLGQEGEVKEVANGYARNFLFPRGLAIPATAGALKQAEARRTHAARQIARVVSEAEKLAAQLNGLDAILFARVGEQNRLYGAITAADVATALKEQHNVTVDRRKVTLDSPVHRTGNYTATVNLGRNITAKINVTVESEANKEQVLEARRQAAAAKAAEAAAAAEAPSTPLDAVGTVAGPAAAAVTDAVGTVAEAAGTVAQNVAEAAAPVVQNITEAAAPIIQNVTEGAGNVVEAVTSGVGALVSRVTGQTEEASDEAAAPAAETPEHTAAVSPNADAEIAGATADALAEGTVTDTAAEPADTAAADTAETEREA